MEGDLTWGVEHTIQHTDDFLQNCMPETYIILLNHVTPICSIKNYVMPSMTGSILGSSIQNSRTFKKSYSSTV